MSTAANEAIAERYAADGYAVVRGALTAWEIDALIAETRAICRGERRAIAGVQASDALQPDELALARYLAVHFPHKTSELMRATLRHPAIVAVLQQIIGTNVKCMQSMLFVKAAGMPGQAWHQDEHYIPTRDRSLTGGWIALDDATIENGCLWVIPGSHRAGVLWPTRAHGDARFDVSEEAFGYPWSDDAAIAVEVQRGDVVFFNGYLLHRSLDNRTQRMRRALVYHYMSAESLLPWSIGGRRERADFRDVEIAAGVDPYAYKGYEDIVRPFLRPRDAAQPEAAGWGKPRQAT